jgi:hypothetical protein
MVFGVATRAFAAVLPVGEFALWIVPEADPATTTEKLIKRPLPETMRAEDVTVADVVVGFRTLNA